MRALKDFFTDKVQESERLAAELARHLATWPSVLSEYDRLDQEAVAMAAKLAAATYAGSPRRLELEADLRKLRWSRDSLKAAFGREKERLSRELEAINRKPIAEFVEVALAKLKWLSTRYRETERDRWQVLEDHKSGERDVTKVTLQSNSEAIERARQTILESLQKVRGMGAASLSDLQKVIAGYLEIFDGFDLSATTESEVSLQMLRLAQRDRKPAPTADYEKVSELSGRIDKLERRPR